MSRANISYTRNHLSEMIARVKEGESILIVDRQQPVARLEPAGGPAAEGPAWQAGLVRRGLVRQAKLRLDPGKLGALPLPKARAKGDILETLLSEREEGR